METPFSSIISDSVTINIFIICTVSSLVLGALTALCYMKTSKKYTGSFVTTLAVLPAVIQVIIMMVNGNLGAGVAVAGAFSLVRFRSIPGTAKEIGAIFVALASGLATGMGYIAYAAVFTLTVCLVLILYNLISFGEKAQKGKKILTVVIPEGLDYTNCFDDIFSQYLKSNELVQSKTTNMGSLFKLRYEIVLKDSLKEKEMIDALRCRNGNLEIICSNQILSQEIL